MASSRIEMYVSCQNLRTSDLLSRSDPFAVVSTGHKDSGGKVQYTKLGRTETIGNTNNPEFTHQFLLDYFFHEEQYVKVKVYDDDTITDDDGLGKAEFTLATLMSSRGRSICERLKSRGTVTVRAEEVSSCSENFRITMRGIKLANKDFLSKSDPFFVISRLREDGEWQQVHKSERIDNNLNPIWRTQEMSVQGLCNGDYLRPLRIDLWDWDSNGKHDSLGRITTSLDGILRSQGREIDLEPLKPGKRVRGQVRVEFAEVIKIPTILDFLGGGLQISMMVAIDFTASNGDPSLPMSLHYLGPMGAYNQYQQAIGGIGAVLQQYDSDKMYPVYGFGGRIAFGPVNHCFPICEQSSSDGDSEEVYGVEGILAAYAAAISSVSLAGPTLFSEVLDTAIERAQGSMSRHDQRYEVLVILTDGIINDMPETIHKLVQASKLPLSVVIVGVGDADFTDMSALDGDGGLLTDFRGGTASRDIVQFVAFNNYRHGDSSAQRLAADTIKEIPGQVIAYFKSRGISPNPPRPLVVSRPPPTAPPTAPMTPLGGEDDRPPPYAP